MKKIALALITAASAAGALSTAHAEDLKPYIGASVIGSEHKYNLSNDTSNGDRKSTEYGGKIYGGVMFDKNFGLEAGYTDFGKSSYGYTVNGLNGNIDAHAKSYYIAGKASWPVNEQINVFGKLGVAHNKNDVTTSGLAAVYNTGDSSKTSVYAGVGAEYAFNQKVSAVVEYEHYGKNDIDQGRRKGAISVGAKFNF
jgi:OOP family OmpA-OmpF porin